MNDPYSVQHEMKSKFRKSITLVDTAVVKRSRMQRGKSMCAIDRKIN